MPANRLTQKPAHAEHSQRLSLATAVLAKHTLESRAPSGRHMPTMYSPESERTAQSTLPAANIQASPAPGASSIAMSRIAIISVTTLNRDVARSLIPSASVLHAVATGRSLVRHRQQHRNDVDSAPSSGQDHALAPCSAGRRPPASRTACSSTATVTGPWRIPPLIVPCSASLSACRRLCHLAMS